MIETTRYFESQVLDDDDEISEAVALRRKHYVVARYVDGDLDRVEIVGPGGIETVAYHQLPSLSAQALAEHQRRFPGAFIQLKIAAPGGDERAAEVQTYDKEGHLLETLARRLSASGDILKEELFDALGQKVGERTYDYDATGDLFRVTEIDALGRARVHDLS